MCAGSIPAGGTARPSRTLDFPLPLQQNYELIQQIYEAGPTVFVDEHGQPSVRSRAGLSTALVGKGGVPCEQSGCVLMLRMVHCI